MTNPPTTTTTTSTELADASTTSTMMTAVTQRHYGSADTLDVEQIERPRLGEREVMIEVVAAGLDRGVWHLMTGTPYLIRLLGFGLFKPKQSVPGADVAGRVVEVGGSVGRFAPGDEVMGIARGSFAEYAVADADKLAPKPSNVSFEHGAASTISGITALQALTTVGRVEAGQRVLVVGASGGVGSFAVQIAKTLGAFVTGVASTDKLDFVRSLGADDVVDYTQTDLTELDDRFDLIVDIGGRNPLSKLRHVLTPTGTLVIVGGEDGGRFTGGIGRNLRAVLSSMFTKQRLTFFISSESRQYIDPLVEMVASGEVTPAIGRQARLDETADAVREIEAGTATGKTVIVIGADGS